MIKRNVTRKAVNQDPFLGGYLQGLLKRFRWCRGKFMILSKICVLDSFLSKISDRLKTVNYFCKKDQSYIFSRFLNKPLW